MNDLGKLYQPSLGWITSPATVDELFQRHPTVNRVILKNVGDQKWELVKYASDRPTDLRKISLVTNDYFGYERNAKRGWESLTGYDINVDATFKVIYRLPSV